MNPKGEDLAVEGEDGGAAIFQIVTTLKTRPCLLASVLCMYLNIPQNEAAFPLPKIKYKKKKMPKNLPESISGVKEKEKKRNNNVFALVQPLLGLFAKSQEDFKSMISFGDSG